ncbi:hypothetical protein OQA88_7158 [Cercophora sp. LCS_1]
MLAKNIFAIPALLATAFAAPSNGPAGDVGRSDPRIIEAPTGSSVKMYANDDCTGQINAVEWREPWGPKACYPAPSPARSVLHTGTCKVTTWSGINCRGTSEEIVGRTVCQNYVYGSVLIECPPSEP